MIDRALPFADRADAGRQLAERLESFAGRDDVVVLALPRGGVPVGAQVARALGAPFDVFVVRKLGVPGHEEYAMGAIASGGTLVMSPDVVEALQIPRPSIEQVIAREQQELARRERLYRGDRAPVDVRGKSAILVDDGLATGATMRAAVRAVRKHEPAHVTVAVPVAAADTCVSLRDEADEVVCAYTPEPFRAVGLWYRDFSQTSDDEVRELLREAGANALAERRR
jgi:predicted phosphoribosyltransferase